MFQIIVANQVKDKFEVVYTESYLNQRSIENTGTIQISCFIKCSTFKSTTGRKVRKKINRSREQAYG